MLIARSDYDSYVFVRFWTPEACYREYDAGCKMLNSDSYGATHFTLHGMTPLNSHFVRQSIGLWPQFSEERDGNSYPAVRALLRITATVLNVAKECYENNSTYWEHVSDLQDTVLDAMKTQWNQYAPEYLNGVWLRTLLP